MNSISRLVTPLTFAVIAALAIALYVPFLGNPRVFDDTTLFLGGMAGFATNPFSLSPRTFPYFTIAAIDVVTQFSEVANRSFGLVLHVSAACLLAYLCQIVLRHVACERGGSLPTQCDPRYIGVVAGALFAVHPVAVYGAGYLAQRTIVCATLFSIVSVILLEHGLRMRSVRRVLVAGMAYWAAVLCKEHAIMLPVAAVALVVACRPEIRRDAHLLFGYLLMCLPAALHVLLGRSDVVGQTYEPDHARVLAELPIAALTLPFGKWLVSAVIQMGLFWDYLLLWIIPGPQWLSIDLRIDFVQRWNVLRAASSSVAFLAVPVLGGFAIFRAGARARLTAAGLLWFWALFLTELSAPRFQEPFVLYRSYLWAPGIFIAIAPWLISVPSRLRIGVGAIVILLAATLAYDRLRTFSSDELLWNDAVQKLSAPTLPGSMRVFYNRGRALMRANKLDQALEDYSYAVSLAPDDFRPYLGRGVVLSRLQRFDEAIVDLDRAARIRIDVGDIHNARGNVLNKLGRKAEARSAYERAVAFNHRLAKFQLEKLDKASEPTVP